ncbi:hypothetical protein ATCC90586_000965 [Pythium insidiosum]|nr:hypothetical protein ATCC90586_000965 [Pythium insidiosum]
MPLRDALLLLLLAVSAAATAAQRQGVSCGLVGSPWSAVTNLCLCAPCHLCEFSWRRWRCQLTARADMDLSDGSAVTPRQPTLEPASWFLTDAEMTAARGNVPRRDVELFTTQNVVEAFVATNEFFDAVFNDLEKTRAKDRVLITGWSFDDVPLRPAASAGNESLLSAVFSRLVGRGAELHVLGYANVLETEQNVAMQQKVNALPAPKHGKTRFLLDDRLPDITAAHHQKSIVVKRPDGLVAFVGGVDLTNDRWDTVQHDQSQLRKRTGIAKSDDTLGWVDAHVRISGRAAKDVAINFLSRWNMPRAPLQDASDGLAGVKNPSYSALPAIDQGEPLMLVSSGSHAVQLIRTYSCKYGHYKDFAPSGEVSYYHALLKAIKSAKNYVYIEDQYFLYVKDLQDALLAALPTLQRVIIVVQRPVELTAKLAGYKKYQFDMITPLQQRFPNKVQVYSTKASRKLYIHSKLVIVDDVYASIGSANWNARSMTSDTELGVGLVDEQRVASPDKLQVGKLVRSLRVRKFMEHTGKKFDEIDKLPFLAAANLLDAAAASRDTIIERYQVAEEASFVLYSKDIQGLVDQLHQCDVVKK